MRIAITSFRGEAPRITPRALPENGAQVAENCRLQSGDLESWRQFALTKNLANTGPVQTVYLLNGAWLSWNAQVDVARGVIAGDQTFRAYLTAPALYGLPQFTNYAMATTGAEPYPVATRPLGVPGPVTAPTTVIGVDANPTTFAIDVKDAGDALATKWIVSPPRVDSTRSVVTQDTGNGNPSPCYRVEYDEIHNDGEQPFAYRNFGIESASVARMQCDVFFPSAGADTGYLQACILVQCDVNGAGVMAQWDNRGTLQIIQTKKWSVFGAAVLGSGAAAAPSTDTWYTLSVQAVSNADGTSTITATIAAAATPGTVVTTATATGNLTKGDYCGFTNGIPDDAGSTFITFYDNFRVQASGSTNYVANNTATSYVYTFVNDLGEESPPSPASITLLRPEGVTVTVATPTVVPPGTPAAYGITTKRLYRGVTGATGSVFIFLVEQPLATATYADTLDDSQIADNDVLESDYYDLPPPTWRASSRCRTASWRAFGATSCACRPQDARTPGPWPTG